MGAVALLFAVALWYTYEPAPPPATVTRHQRPCEAAVWARAVAEDEAAGERMVRELEEEARMMQRDPVRGMFASERRDLQRQMEASHRKERLIEALASCEQRELPR